MVPKELTAIRERLGLGPVDMARAMGISYTTYRDWQAGRRRIPPVAARCAELLLELPHCRVRELVDRAKS